MIRPRNPKTREEWQDAVNAADELLLIDSARQYSLVKTDLRPNIERCEEILRMGAARDIIPSKELRK